MVTFAAASSVVRRQEGSWVGRIQPGWDIFGIANGGYLMAMAARAMGEEAPDRDLTAMSAHFLNPGEPGPVEVRVEVIKTGRDFTTLSSTMTAGDSPVLASLASFSDRDRRFAPAEIVHSSPPDLPSPEHCVLAEPSSTGPLPPPFMGKVIIMIHPDDAAALSGDRTGVARVRGWFRLLEDEPADPYAVLMAADSFPPAVFNTNLPLKWTPTLQMSTHIRGTDRFEWLKCQFRTRYVTGGLLEEDGEIWGPDGSLVAQSRQLALVPR